jgi:AraC-like DNA-binding protein
MRLPSAFTAAFRRHFNLLPSQVAVLGLRSRADG